MRSRYLIQIDASENQKIESALHSLGISFGPAAHCRRFRDWYEYDVSLSKYELLILRLSCKTGTVTRIENQQNMSSEMAQSPS
jgi:hypothetical protein